VGPEILDWSPSNQAKSIRLIAIRVRLLGSSAGGGLPQWNCACPNCREARAGRIPARTQSSVSVSADGVRWYLINASPDLRVQIESFPPLQPRPGLGRNSPVEGVLLTNADLDHVLGLFLLREGEPLILYATETVRQTLSRALRIDRLLDSFCGVTWRAPSFEFSALATRDGSASGLYGRAIFLPGTQPLFADQPIRHNEGHSIAWQIADGSTGARLLVAPDVAAMTSELRTAMEESEAVLLDGTFWSSDEMSGVKRSARTASEMGHLPVLGSLEVFHKLQARYKIYIHINNTNPILALDSSERALVERAGIAVGEDGMEFEL
jgi:pyrroloquinoline quinone biosynthesis protein B